MVGKWAMPRPQLARASAILLTGAALVALRKRYTATTARAIGRTS